MKVVILAGGLGTRLSEETVLRPKPMVEIGGRPILWHIMKQYSAHGLNEFIICLGYKGYMIKEYFANYFMHNSSVTIDLKNNSVQLHDTNSEPWKITLVDTGEDAMTGGRLLAVKDYIDTENFCFTYGDGVSDINITEQIAFHKAHGKLSTITAIQPPGRYGVLTLDKTKVSGFTEKPHGEGGWINGGFFILNKKVISLLEGPGTIWESNPMTTLASQGEMQAYFHHGFWQAMDTLRDRTQLENMWAKNQAPWKTWKS